MIVLFYRVKMISDNLKSVTQRITRCCEKMGKGPGCVTLICVAKEVGPREIKEAVGLGVKDIGENRVQDALSKYKVLGDIVRWHMIGHLQTNKVKDALKIFSLIHSVDSMRLAEEIDKEAGRAKKVQDILIQVNVSGEDTKFGIRPDEAGSFIKAVSLCANINIRGLMTIAPEVKDPETVRPYFRKLRALMDEINSLKLTAYSLQLLSMGMTNDFEVAIEEGSNMVRIGRAIFKC